MGDLQQDTLDTSTPELSISIVRSNKFCDFNFFRDDEDTGMGGCLTVELPLKGESLIMKVPHSLLQLCFGITLPTQSIECIRNNAPLFVEAARSQYRKGRSRMFELTESAIAEAQRNLAIRSSPLDPFYAPKPQPCKSIATRNCERQYP